MATDPFRQLEIAYLRDRQVRTEALLRRVRVQVEFASAFADSKNNSAWRGLVAKARELVSAGPSNLEELASQVETLLAPIGLEAKKLTMHLVGHGHIDMNWMWSWPETVSITRDTFASVLNLMDQYPELTYSQSQASVYDIVERYDPDMFEKIKQRVKEGRWEVTAVHWVEGDKNLASGEALCRHMLYTRNYFQEKFGLSPEDVPVEWEPDTFGHAHTLPMIVASGGAKYYYSCRQGGGHGHKRVGDERPSLYWWRAQDGSRILVNRETTWYNSYVNIGENYALPLLAFVKETGLTHWLNVFGIGNHGGGPTRDEIDYFLESREWPIWPTVKFSTSTAYFDAVAKEGGKKLPELTGELNFEFTGCYTSQSAIKKANRYGENYCQEAEGLAAATGLYVRAGLEQAWRNVLFNQFHDILPGSGVAATRNHALALFQETGAITGTIKRRALEILGSGLNTLSLIPESGLATSEAIEAKGGMARAPYNAGAGIGAGETGYSANGTGGRNYQPFLIWNPLPWERTEIVTIDLYDSQMEPGRIVAMDESHHAHPVLVLGQSEDWGHKKISVAFEATVPAFGYRTFLFCEGVPDSSGSVVIREETEVSNGSLSFAFDRYGAGFYARSAHLPNAGWMGNWNLTNEISRGMTAWVLGGFQKPVELTAGHYSIRGAAVNDGTAERTGSSPVVLITRQMEVPGTESKVTLRTWVGSRDRLDFEAEIDWREIGTADRGIPGLEVAFGHLDESALPLADFDDEIDDEDELDDSMFETKDLVFEVPFGVIKRPVDLDEVPTLRFVHDPNGGYTVLQDSKYGFWTTDRLAMRVLRSSFDPDHAPEVGKSTLRYSVVFHDKEPGAAELVRLGAEQNHPFIVAPVALQSGTGKTTASFAEAEGDASVVSSIKPAQDGNGVIVRLVNYGSKKDTAKVAFAGPLAFAKAEVVDALERSIVGEAKIQANTLGIVIPAGSTVAVRLS